MAAGGRAGKFFGGVRGAAGRGVKNAKDFAREHPIAAGLGAAGTAAFTAEPTADFMADLFSDRKLKREIQRTADLTDLDWARAMKMERLQRSNAENMGRLAALSPEVYAQLTAGRTLPRGAVVIGGVPNVDGLGAIATAMSTGQFNRGLSVEDQYLAGLTR